MCATLRSRQQSNPNPSVSLILSVLWLLMLLMRNFCLAVDGRRPVAVDAQSPLPLDDQRLEVVSAS